MILSTLLLAVPSAALQSPAQAPAPVEQTAEAQLAELTKRYDASKLSYPDRFAAFREEYAALAEAHSGTAVGMDAEVFLLTGLWWSDEEGRSAAALEQVAELRKHYGQSKHLVKLLEPINFLVAKEKRGELLQEIAKSSPHPEVQGVALLFRARAAKGDERKEMLRKLDKVYGSVRYKYSSLHEIADALLNPHARESLAVGQPAPEITGVDLHGKPMKLSDFRGKVVVLDFWGDW